MPLCSPWLDLDTDDVALCRCSVDDFEDGLLAAKIVEASHLLYYATGERFPGICTDTIRPCAAGCGGVQYLAYGRGGSRPIGVDECGCRGLGGTGCTATGVALPRRPVLSVDEVRIDGQVVDPSTYRLADRHVLMRQGAGWPCSQDLARPDTDERTFAIDYTYGGRPDPAGLAATAALACELARACTPGAECRLPERLQSLTREGVTMTVLDPFDFLDQSRFGLYEVDAWIAGLDRARGQRAGRVISPGTLGPHHR